MSKNTLEVLLDSTTRPKILKFLFRNMDRQYTLADIVNHTREDRTKVRKEIAKLLDIKLLRKETKRARATIGLNRDFEFFAELRELVLKQPPSEKTHLVEQIHKLGKIKVAVIAGIFLDKENKDPLAVDMFLVHDYLDRRKLTLFLKNVEADLGKEIRFATMDKEEFKYRLGMFDRFIRVLLEGPHEKLINKMGL